MSVPSDEDSDATETLSGVRIVCVCVCRRGPAVLLVLVLMGGLNIVDMIHNNRHFLGSCIGLLSQGLATVHLKMKMNASNILG